TSCSYLQSEQWRGVIFVTKPGEPLLVPQTPLLDFEASRSAKMKVTVTFVHTPLREVCKYLDTYPEHIVFSLKPRFEVANEIADRQVTASFHDIPLQSVIEVVCRLADCKMIPTERGGSSLDQPNTFIPREPLSS